VTPENLKRLSLYFAGLVFVISGLDILGWCFNLPILTSFVSGAVTMKINTALGFILTALSLILLNKEESGTRQIAGRICGIFVCAIGLLTLIEYVAGIDLRIDDLFLAVPNAEANNPFPSRMAPLTALGLMSVGLALTLIDSRKRSRFGPSQILASVALTAGVVVLVGHLYGSEGLYRIGSYTAMSVPASLAFTLTGVSVLFARTAYCLPDLLLRQTNGAALARRLLPTAIAVPLLLGWLRVAGERAGLYGLGFGTGVLAVAMAAAFVSLVWWTSSFMDRMDRDRQLAEVVLRQRDEDLRFMAESMPQKTFTATCAGAIEYLNHQWMEFTGASFDRLRDWGWLQFVHPDDVQETIHRWKQSIETHKDFRMEHRFYRNDGVYRWHLSFARAMRDPDGAVLKWVGFNTEIHDQKLVQQDLLRAKERADRANQSKDEFLALVSHELRTPLSSILGWARLLVAGKLDERQAAMAVNVIDRSATAQTKLIEDLLDVARMITGKFALTTDEVDLDKIISASIASVMPAADAKRIEINKVIDSKLMPIEGDPVRLQQVFWNLLHNAIKFSPNGSHIEVHVAQTGSNLRVTVKDTGRGIDPAFLPYIFERFHQADSTATRQHGGLGLGLTIVRHLVEAHGGTVQVESAGIGHGSAFHVDLPAQTVPYTNHQFYPAPDLEKEKGLAGLRLLAVEDDSDARELVRTILAAAGASVIAVPSAEDALAELDLGVPDVIVADVGMPGKDGYQLLREIRSRDQSRGGHVPAIALTAYARKEDRISALNAGFQMHLTKPVDPTGLVYAVARLAASDPTS